MLGSVLAAVYRDQIDGAVSALPAPAREAASESIAGAYGVAERAGPAGGGRSSRRPTTPSSRRCTGPPPGRPSVALLSVAVVLRWLPRRAGPHPAAASEPPSGPIRELAERH